MVESAIRAEGLVRMFPGGAGVHGIALDVRYGEVHALVGRAWARLELDH